MKKILFGAATAFLTLSAGTFTEAQTVTGQPTQISTVSGQQAANKWVISAKAGGVNFTEGTVNFSSPNGRYGLVLKGDVLEVGDKIITGTDGRAEVLLNPGSFVRLGANSEFNFETTDLNDLQLNLSKGSAMFEVFASQDFVVKINTPTNKFELVESGIYRIDIEPDGDSAVAVWKGRAVLNGNTDSAVKRGRTGTSDDGAIELVKFNRGDRDELAQWSRERAKEITRMNSTLRPRDIRDSLMSGFDHRQWDMFNSFGLWVYNPYRGGFSFLPFGSGWSSPYGHWFHYDIWNYRLPGYIFMPVPPRPPVNGGGNQGNVPTTPNPSQTGSRTVPADTKGVQPARQQSMPANVNSRQQRTAQAPPFVNIQRNGNIDARPANINQGARPSIIGPSAPSAAPVRIPAPPAAPAPNPTGARRP